MILKFLFNKSNLIFEYFIYFTLYIRRLVIFSDLNNILTLKNPGCKGFLLFFRNDSLKISQVIAFHIKHALLFPFKQYTIGCQSTKAM